MGLIVQKFGGSSLANRACMERVADKIRRYRARGDQVVTVVSAQGDSTDQLLALAGQYTESPDPRELDALLATGEAASAALLALLLIGRGVPAVSMSGRQAGILTDSRHGNATILRINAGSIREKLEQGSAVIVAGFQGADARGDVCTLGRGGSDTSAVALAAALGAGECLIYKDVDGIYSSDPHKDSRAVRYSSLTYEEMLALVDRGSGVLQRQSVELARKSALVLKIRSSFHDAGGTIIHA